MTRKIVTLAVVGVLAAAAGAGGYVALTVAAPAGHEPRAAETVDPLSVIAPTTTGGQELEGLSPVVDAEPGQVLDAKPGDLPDGLLSYPLLDGRHVVVDPAGDLPDLVMPDLTARSTAELATTAGDPGAVALALTSISEDAIATTGRSVVVVYPVRGMLLGADDREPGDGWVFWGRDTEANATYQSAPAPSPDDAAALGAHWVAEHGGAARHAIVTVTP